MSDDEVWKPIPGFDGYEASSAGRIRNARLGHVLTGTVTRKGYRQVNLRGPRGRTCQYAHRLVASAFFGVPPPGYVTNHLNCDKLDCRPANLEFTTPSGNARHASAHGRLKPVRLVGERNPRAKLTADGVRAMRALRQQGATYAELGRRFGVTGRAAQRVVTRKDWKHVG